MYSDLLDDLPIDENNHVKQQDLSLLLHILRPEEPQKNSSFDYVKIISVAVLFLVLSLPVVNNFIAFYTKNNVIITKAILIVLFVIFYIFIDKFL